jgi:uncharacterized protein YjbK
LKDLNFTIKASPSTSKDFVQFDIDEIQMDVKDFGLEIEGGDVSTIINNFSDVLEEFVKTYLLGRMDASTRISI